MCTQKPQKWNLQRSIKTRRRKCIAKIYSVWWTLRHSGEAHKKYCGSTLVTIINVYTRSGTFTTELHLIIDQNYSINHLNRIPLYGELIEKKLARESFIGVVVLISIQIMLDFMANFYLHCWFIVCCYRLC